MPRGQASELGTETVNQNGYTQVKTERGWIPKHVLTMEEHLGRQLGKGERVRFKNGDRTNWSLDNLELYIVGTRSSSRKRIADLRARIAELQAQLAYEEELLAKAEEAAAKS
jgi:hypothetical protein